MLWVYQVSWRPGARPWWRGWWTWRTARWRRSTQRNIRNKKKSVQQSISFYILGYLTKRYIINTSVSNLGGFYPAPTFEKKLDPDPTFDLWEEEKNRSGSGSDLKKTQRRIRILSNYYLIKLNFNFFSSDMKVNIIDILIKYYHSNKYCNFFFKF